MRGADDVDVLMCCTPSRNNKRHLPREIFPLPLFFAGVFFAVLLTIIPLHNIENKSYFEYYALLWSHGLSPFCSPARFLTIIVCKILKMNHI